MLEKSLPGLNGRARSSLYLNPSCRPMPTLIITRTPAFKRGMQSIQLSMDGRKAGTLWNDKPCSITVPPGRHTILPKKIGVRGQAFEITVTEGETHYLTLHDVSISRDFGGLLIICILINSIPDGLLGGMLMLWIKIAFFAVEFTALAYLLRGHRQKKITISEGSSVDKASIENLASYARP